MLAVVGALIANALITVLKFIAAAMTGSSGIMAEALHSLADTTNQIFLLIGLRRYKRPANERHQFGFGMERFFWSFIAAIFIFGVGATYAIYEGIAKLSHPHAPEHILWAYIVLALSFVLESGSIALALYQEITEARHQGLTFFEYLKESKDPTAKTVIFEDSAALLGIVIAAVGVFLVDQGYGLYWDGVASISIGAVLAVVAFALAKSSRALLLGEAASPKSVAKIRAAILEHVSVVDIVELLTMHLGPNQILLNAHINFRDEMTALEITRAIDEIELAIRTADPSVDLIFLEAARRRAEVQRERQLAT